MDVVEALPRKASKKPRGKMQIKRRHVDICAAGPDYTSELSSQVVHVLVHEVHSYVLNWEYDWSTLDKVLLSLGKVHRFADVGINLCNTIERTLEAAMPTAPDVDFYSARQAAGKRFWNLWCF